MLRWAVVTASGKNLRVYQENRLKAVQLVMAQMGERHVSVEPAGSWDGDIGASHVRESMAEGNGDLRLRVPEWDAMGDITGWPGGPSGRPR
jgi:hypothetical protein